MYGSLRTAEDIALAETSGGVPRFFCSFLAIYRCVQIGLGAILAQQQEGKERIFCCASQTLSKSEQNYSTMKKECLAVVWGIKNFRNYLIANHFKVYTDHYSLHWVRSMKHESALLHHWAAQLEDYDFEVLHRPGKNQGHADALSRLFKDAVHLLGSKKTTLKMAKDTRKVLQRLHEEGHLGLKKTLKLFQRKFAGVWEKTLCQEVISDCIGCQVGSDYRPKEVPKGKIESDSPWDVLSIDVMGPFVAGRKGEQCILSVIDCFSRYLMLVPLRDHTATTVSRALFERVIGYFGCPQRILSDRGTEFTGQAWTELMELLGILQMLTSPYYPQGNGIIERSHRTVSNMIHSHLVHRDDHDWVDVPGIMLMYNVMEKGQHGYSALQVMWGQGMNLPANLLYGTRNTGESDKHWLVQNLERELREVREKVAPFNRNIQKVAKNPFKEGEFILVYQQPMERTHKFSPQWRGPYEVTKVLNPFQLQYHDEGRQKVTQARNCKKFCSMANHGNERRKSKEGG